MITFSDFYNKWNGKACMVLPSTIADNVNVPEQNKRGQCYDAVVAWTDALNIPHYPNNPSPFPYINAYQIYTDFGSFQAQYFDRIFNGPNDIPKEGDIIVWSYAYNGLRGHTGVCKKADLYTLDVFSQNDPLSSVMHVQHYDSYSPILGWLRPKVYNQSLTHNDLYLKAIQSARNEAVTAKQQDPNFKTNTAKGKALAQEIINLY